MKRLAASLPFQLLFMIICAGVCSSVLPLAWVTGCYTLSSVVRELLEFFLPAVVFFFVSSGIMAFRSRSVVMVAVLLLAVFFSNALTALYTYFVGASATASFIGSLAQGCSFAGASVVKPIFSLNLPVFVRSEHAMLAALVVGVGASLCDLPGLRALLGRGKWWLEWGLSRFFISILPLYVFGFFLKLFLELPVRQLCGVYGAVLVLSVVLQVAWLAVVYGVVTQFRIGDALQAITTAAPSYLTALGTMSSVATVPVSVACAEKNTGNSALAHFAMPILANIHLMGDAVCVPLFTLATMQLFMGATPDIATFLLFVGYLCITMLAVSGIPGGGIIAMLPLLKGLFGFTPEMLSVMTALYLLQDGFGTAANVMGDGALVIVLNKVAHRLFGGQRKESHVE